MSFAKAEQLLDLATMLRARRSGITLNDVENRFGCSRRTAQRMMRQLESRFPDVQAEIEEDGCKRWRMPTGGIKDFLSLHADELAALDFAIAHLARQAHPREARLIDELKAKILALVPGPTAARIAPDHDALLEAQGFVARPGPRSMIDEALSGTIADALKACAVLEIDYQARTDPAPRRRAIVPYGVLAGARRYLVGRPEGDQSGPVRTYRMDQIRAASLTTRTFVRPLDFDLAVFAERAFGLYQNEREYGEVAWRFTPAASAHARGYLFHPSQTVADEVDGSLTIRFKAAGHLEMAWHLYQWGDAVEVLAPARLRAMVEAHRRSDFAALP